MKRRLAGMTCLVAVAMVWLAVADGACRAADVPAASKETIDQIVAENDFANLKKQQAAKAVGENERSVIANADKLAADLNMTRERNRLWAIGLLLAAMIVSLFGILYFLLKTRHSADDIVHASGLVLIIFGTIIIVLMIEVDQQLTTAIGVMGAMAGYLFGTMRRGKEEKADA